MTTRLLFSKLLLNLLFSHKILIFLKKIWGVQTYYWTPQFYSGKSMDPLDPPVADPMIPNRVKIFYNNSACRKLLSSSRAVLVVVTKYSGAKNVLIKTRFVA